ncbi:hypothetical protein PI124_g21897 [Phytophthora idaei]|nr:hypothetical protein PI125_g21085 [Phytophthora idaei]KAG3142140.1 hypothetical protein PI126_g15177 [Phytophthora idaei]KAG3233025.1 hypothetical protein PI124_g21897 [Phytophthora idaei]
MVVLSDAEKYARAQSLFEPVTEKLSGLPTVEFYEQMIKWKSVVDSGQGTTSVASSFTDVDSTAMETTESDSDSFFDQLAYAGVMADMEADQELAMKADSIAALVRERNVSVQDGDDSETGESPPLSDNDECKPTQVSDGSDEKELPTPKCRTRKKTKQGWITPQPRFAAVLVSSKVIMTLTQILQWASYHPNVEKVSNVLDQYPVRMTDKFIDVRPVTCAVAEEASEANSIDHAFVIPEALLKKADAAMLQKKELLEEEKEDAPWGLLVSFGSKSLVLHSYFLNRMKQFYVLKANTRSYIEDTKWLKQEWRFVQAHPVEPFSLETKTSGLLHSEAARDA